MITISKQTFIGFLIGVMCCFGGVMLWAAAQKASIATPPHIPRVLNYHGTLTDANGVPIQGVKRLTFCIYAAPVGGTASWCETQDVPLNDGNFSVVLGTVTPIPADLFDTLSTAYLGIQIDSSSELTPRQPITSVAYAFLAQTASNAYTLGGRPPEDFASAAHTHQGADVVSAVPQAVNADTVDGKHATELAPASHTHGGGDITSAVPDADKVDGFHASSNPGANRLLALDGNAKWPFSTMPPQTVRMAMGAYAGNGSNNRPITGLGFSPDWVLVYIPDNSGPHRPEFKGRNHPGTRSQDFDANWHTNAILSLDADGFTLGGSGEGFVVNQPGVNFGYIAFGD